MTRLGRLGLRARLMVIGIAGLSLALLIGGVGFYGALTLAVNRTLDNEALAGAEEVAALVNTDRLPTPIPVSGAQVVQVVDAQSRVVAGSATADRLIPLLRPAELARALGGQPVVVNGNRLGLSGPLRVRAVQAGPAGAPLSVIVALPVGDVLAVRTALRAALLITGPLLLVVLAAIAWRVIGRTLRPVEELRAGAERISNAARDERLPVPHAADEIQALALTLNGMLGRLAAGQARQRAFIADAAHELRSPLASIRTQLEVATRLGAPGAAGPPDDGLVADLLVDIERLTVLVEDLLMLARTDADSRAPARRVLLRGADVVREVAAGYGGARVPVGVRVEHEAPLAGEPDELRRAVANLVDNAVRHARTAVEVAAEVRGSDSVLTVSDDGPGVPEADRERVFERFTRLDDARARDSGGSGLGLAIVRELVLRSGGQVRLADGPPPWTLRAEIALPNPTVARQPSGNGAVTIR